MSTPFRSFTRTSNSNNFAFEDDRMQNETSLSLHSFNPWQKITIFVTYFATILKIQLKKWEKLGRRVTYCYPKNICTSIKSCLTLIGAWYTYYIRFHRLVCKNMHCLVMSNYAGMHVCRVFIIPSWKIYQNTNIASPSLKKTCQERCTNIQVWISPNQWCEGGLDWLLLEDNLTL